jgi:Peptidase propeptide and YPEB domain
MQKRMLSTALAASLLCAGGVVFAQNVPAQSTRTATVSAPAGALSEDAIKADIASAGYKEVKGLKFKDGVWQAKARGGNDNWVRIKVGPSTGKVYQADAPSTLNADEIKAKLTAQGYQNIGHVKFDDGLWSADAKNAQGQDVDLLVDPNDGSVVAVEQD